MTRKYPVQDLAVGETITLPWRGGTYKTTSQKSLFVAVWRAERNAGKKFATERTPAGLMVTRLA